MRCIVCVIGVVVLALFAVGECKVPPIVPCSFTADVKYTHDFDGAQVAHGRFMYYSIEGKGYAKVGVNPQIHLGGDNCTLIVLPETTTKIVPFVNHHVCVIYSNFIAMDPCPVFDEATLVQESVTCPFNSQFLCDHWSAHYSMYDYYIRTDTSEVIIDHLDINYGSLKQHLDFVSFSHVVPPDSVLEVPKTQPCQDYSDDKPEESLYEVGPFGAFMVKEHNSPIGDMLINDPKKLHLIRKNLGPNPQWKVGAYPFFDGLTHRDFAKMFQKPDSFMFDETVVHTRAARKPTKKQLRIADYIPSNFDSREQWPVCIGAIRNQLACGSCWAHSSAEAFSDRICIASGMKKVVTMSPQYMVNCYTQLLGCGGGLTDIAHYDMRDIGVAEESCVPYKMSDQNCSNVCEDGSKMTLYKIRDVYDMYKAFDTNYTVRAIQTEIMTHGPVSATMNVFSDFENYAGGIYSPSKGSHFGGEHSVKIIGWGEENGTPYWIVANSFGEHWGEKGFFRIVRGKNTCGIEDETVTGMPDI